MRTSAQNIDTVLFFMRLHRSVGLIVPNFIVIITLVYKKKLVLSCFRSVNWFWIFRGCWIQKWTQFLSITSRFLATLEFLFKNDKNAIQML